MSKGWAGGSTAAWRQLRSERLFLDGGLCQLKLEGCATYANQVHHLDGVKAGLICPIDRLQSACQNCNLRVGDPTKNGDPEPNPPRTNW